MYITTITKSTPSRTTRTRMARCLNAHRYQRKRLNVINAPATDSAPHVLAYTKWVVGET